jgi:hypothetical protein
MKIWTYLFEYFVPESERMAMVHHQFIIYQRRRKACVRVVDN